MTVRLKKAHARRRGHARRCVLLLLAPARRSPRSGPGGQEHGRERRQPQCSGLLPGRAPCRGRTGVRHRRLLPRRQRLRGRLRRRTAVPDTGIVRDVEAGPAHPGLPVCHGWCAPASRTSSTTNSTWPTPSTPTGVATQLPEGTKENIPATLTQVDGEWRIAEIPDGTAIPEETFKVIYGAYPIYFYDPTFHLCGAGCPVVHQEQDGQGHDECPPGRTRPLPQGRRRQRLPLRHQTGPRIGPGGLRGRPGGPHGQGSCWRPPTRTGCGCRPSWP